MMKTGFSVPHWEPVANKDINWDWIEVFIANRYSLNTAETKEARWQRLKPKLSNVQKMVRFCGNQI